MPKRKRSAKYVQHLVNRRDIDLLRDREKYYLGTARVDLEHLEFQTPYAREFDAKNYEFLVFTFKSTGCHREKPPEHHIPVVIQEVALKTAIAHSDGSADDVRSCDPAEWPRLNFPTEFRLLCLHGRHRIEAAKQCLSGVDRWWVVDLYSDG
jgi:hypothetical protein